MKMISIVVANACQPRQPCNIHSLEELRVDLIHPKILICFKTTSVISVPGCAQTSPEVPQLSFLHARHASSFSLNVNLCPFLLLSDLAALKIFVIYLTLLICLVLICNTCLYILLIFFQIFNICCCYNILNNQIFIPNMAQFLSLNI